MQKSVILLYAFPLILTACGPSDFEKQKLAFEQQKYKDEQAAKAEAARMEEEDKQDQKMKWTGCRFAAAQEYEDDFKLWGTPAPGKPGVRNGPMDQMRDMKNRLQRENEQCDRNFPRGISY